jgi:hypothetical protein
MDSLISILMNGYSYQHTDAEGNVHTTQVAPNKYMIAGAKALVQSLNAYQSVFTELDAERARCAELMQDAEKYRETIRLLEANNAEAKV